MQESTLGDDLTSDCLPLGYSASLLCSDDTGIEEEEDMWLDSSSIGSSLVLQNVRRALSGPGLVDRGLNSLLKRKYEGTPSAVRDEEDEAAFDEIDPLEALSWSENSHSEQKARKRGGKTIAQPGNISELQNDPLAELSIRDATTDSVHLHFLSQDETERGIPDEIITAKTPKRSSKRKKKVTAQSRRGYLCVIDGIEERVDYHTKMNRSTSVSVKTPQRKNKLCPDLPGGSEMHEESLSVADAYVPQGANVLQKKDEANYITSSMHKGTQRRSSVAKKYESILSPVLEHELSTDAERQKLSGVKEPLSKASCSTPSISAGALRPSSPQEGNASIYITRSGRKVAPPYVSPVVRSLISFAFSQTRNSPRSKRNRTEVSAGKKTKRGQSVEQSLQRTENVCQPQIPSTTRRVAKRCSSSKKQVSSLLAVKKMRENAKKKSPRTSMTVDPQVVSVDPEMEKLETNKSPARGVKTRSSITQKNIAISPQNKQQLQRLEMPQVQRKIPEAGKKTEGVKRKRKEENVGTVFGKRPRKPSKNFAAPPKKTANRKIGDRVSLPKKSLPAQKHSANRKGANKETNQEVKKVTSIPSEKESQESGDSVLSLKKPDPTSKQNETVNTKRTDTNTESSQDAKKVSSTSSKKESLEGGDSVSLSKKPGPSSKQKGKGKGTSKETCQEAEKDSSISSKKRSQSGDGVSLEYTGMRLRKRRRKSVKSFADSSEKTSLSSDVVSLPTKSDLTSKRNTKVKTKQKDTAKEVNHDAEDISSFLSKKTAHQSSGDVVSLQKKTDGAPKRKSTRVRGTRKGTNRRNNKVLAPQTRKSENGKDISPKNPYVRLERIRKEKINVQDVNEKPTMSFEKASVRRPRKRRSIYAILSEESQAMSKKKRNLRRKSAGAKDGNAKKQTVGKAVWDKGVKMTLKKLVNKNIGWEEIAEQLGFPAQECEEVYTLLFKKKPRHKAKAKDTGPADITAKPGTLKHRQQVKQVLEGMKKPKPQFQDIFAEDGAVPTSNMFSSDLFAASSTGGNFVLATPGTRPPVGLDATIATPAWFKTPVAGTSGSGSGELTPLETAVTPAGMKEIYSPRVEVGDKDEKRKIADRVIVQMRKKMLRGTLQNKKDKKGNDGQKEERKKQNDEIDFAVLRNAPSSFVDEEMESGVDEYFDFDDD